MKRHIYILLIISFFISCSKNDAVKVEYLSTGAISEYTLYYLDEYGDLMNIAVRPESA